MNRGGASNPLRVLIVDDHEVLRTGTQNVLETADDITVVGGAHDGSSAIEMVGALSPDVALLDIRLPDMDGIELARYLAEHFPGTRVVILSAFDDDDYLRAALSAGVTGYLLKSMSGEKLIAAVRSAGLGTTVLDPAVSSRLARSPSRISAIDEPVRLTVRERQVVRLVAEGLANKAIASSLGVSSRTVEGHLNHVFAKLEITSRTELVRYAIANDLVSNSPDRPR